MMTKEIKIGSKVKDLIFPNSKVHIVKDISYTIAGTYFYLENIGYRRINTVALINVKIQNKLK